MLHGPSNLNVTENAPFASVVVLAEPFLQTNVIAPFCMGAPIAAVPLIVPLGELPPPPQANSALVARAIDPYCKQRSTGVLKRFMVFPKKYI
jgi:hypothetical protein